MVNADRISRDVFTLIRLQLERGLVYMSTTLRGVPLADHNGVLAGIDPVEDKEGAGDELDM